MTSYLKTAASLAAMIIGISLSLPSSADTDDAPGIPQLEPAAIGAAIHHHPHGRPVLACRTHGLIDFGPGIVAGDEHQMGGRHRRHDGERGDTSCLRPVRAGIALGG